MPWSVTSFSSARILRDDCLQDTSIETRWKLCSSLPLTMRRAISIRGRAKYFQARPPGKTMIRSALASIVARAASTQSVKGLVTAGLLKSASYLLEKTKKRLGWAPSPQTVASVPLAPFRTNFTNILSRPTGNV